MTVVLRATGDAAGDRRATGHTRAAGDRRAGDPRVAAAARVGAGRGRRRHPPRARPRRRRGAVPAGPRLGLGAGGRGGARARRGGHDRRGLAVAGARRATRPDAGAARGDGGVLPLAVPQHDPARRGRGRCASGRGARPRPGAGRAGVARGRGGAHRPVRRCSSSSQPWCWRFSECRPTLPLWAPRFSWSSSPAPQSPSRRRRTVRARAAIGRELAALRQAFGTVRTVLIVVVASIVVVAVPCGDLRRRLHRRRHRCVARAADRRRAHRGARRIDPAEPRRLGPARRRRSVGVRGRRHGSGHRRRGLDGVRGAGDDRGAARRGRGRGIRSPSPPTVAVAGGSDIVTRPYVLLSCAMSIDGYLDRETPASSPCRTRPTSIGSTSCGRRATRSWSARRPFGATIRT